VHLDVAVDQEVASEAHLLAWRGIRSMAVTRPLVMTVIVRIRAMAVIVRIGAVIVGIGRVTMGIGRVLV
jgi:hypothetical protein